MARMHEIGCPLLAIRLDNRFELERLRRSPAEYALPLATSARIVTGVLEYLHNPRSLGQPYKV